MTSQPRRRRFFFALWPDPATRQALVRSTRDAVRRAGGRATVPENLHITVAFLGAISEEQLSAARGVPPVAASGFVLTLDTMGFWKRPRILWIAPGRIPVELATLERWLWDGLMEVGFEREKRVFLPHLTLGRRASAVTAEIKPVEWPVAELALVESVPGPRRSSYEVRETWPLGA